MRRVLVQIWGDDSKVYIAWVISKSLLKGYSCRLAPSEELAAQFDREDLLIDLKKEL